MVEEIVSSVDGGKDRDKKRTRSQYPLPALFQWPSFHPLGPLFSVSQIASSAYHLTQGSTEVTYVNNANF